MNNNIVYTASNNNRRTSLGFSNLVLLKITCFKLSKKIIT